MFLNHDNLKRLAPSFLARGPRPPHRSGSVYHGAGRGAHARVIERPSFPLLAALATAIAMILSLLIASPAFGQHGGGGHGGGGHGGGGHGGGRHGGGRHGGGGHSGFGHGGSGHGRGGSSHGSFGRGGFGHGGFGRSGGFSRGSFGHGGFGHGGFGRSGGFSRGSFGHGGFGHGGFGRSGGFSYGGFGHGGGRRGYGYGYGHGYGHGYGYGRSYGHYGGLHSGGFGHGSGYGNAYYYANPYYYSYRYPYAYGYPSAYSGYGSVYSYAPSYAYDRYEAAPPMEDYPPIDRHDEAAAGATTRPRRERPTSVKRDGRGGSAMEAGLTLLKKGAYQRATDVLLQAVLSDPEAGLPKLAFADALFATGDYDYAAYAVRRGIDRVSDLAAVLADRRSLFRDDKEFDRLVYHLRHYVERHRKNGDAHFLLGYYQLIMNQPEDARRSFDTALGLDSHDRHALVLRDLAKGHEPAKP